MLKNGNKVMVRGNKHASAFEAVYIGENPEGGHFCLLSWGGVGVYDHVEEMPKPTYSPFTFDTFPRGVVYVRKAGPTEAANSLVTRVDEHMMYYGQTAWSSYHSLWCTHEISTDLCKTWQPAGVLDA